MSVSPGGQLSEGVRQWWRRPEDRRDEEDPKAHEKLFAVVDHIDRTQDYKRSWLLYAEMYQAGSGTSAAAGTSMGGIWRTTPSSRASIGLNITRKVVDSVCSRLFAKSTPHLTYATEGGGPEKQHNAEQLDAGVAGAIYQSNGERHFQIGGRDATVYGTGLLSIRPDYEFGKISFDRLRAWEWPVDDSEVLCGPQRSFYSSRLMDKGVVLHKVRTGQWNETDTEDDRSYKAALIDKLTGDIDEDIEPGYQGVAYRLRLDEAWHLPSGKEAGDGRHVIGVRNCTILDEPWEPLVWSRPVPVISYRWSEPVEGWYGQGVVEIGQLVQAEINKLLRQIQNGHHMITGRWLRAKGSKVTAAHLNNDLTTILDYEGVEPKYITPAIIAPEVYEHLWNLCRQYEAMHGLNEQTTQGQVPIGIRSGEAQRVFAQQQTETLLAKGKRYEMFVREGGQLVTDAARALAKKGAYEVRAFSDDGFETIDWKKLEDPDGYELRVAPTSSLPGTPEGKIELANDMLQLGEFDPADVLEIIGMPDMLQMTKRKQASRKLVEKKVGEMLRDGAPWEPHSLINLDEAIRIAMDLHNLAESKGVDDERLQLVRDLIDKCHKLQPQPPAPPAPPPSGSTPTPPGAAPEGGPPGPMMNGVPPPPGPPS